MKMLNISNLINNFRNFENDYDANNLRESIDFNVFKFIESVFWIDEPKHSRIIAFLLNPEEIHGQKETFLYLFLEMLGIKDFRNNKWNVYAEKGNVDILIRSDSSTKKTIIIENKSNWAIDQDYQLYRYWYQNIFRFNNQNLEASHNTDNNRIIYLSPNEDKIYSLNSISRPICDYDDCEELSLNEKVINTWYFHRELKDWLLKCAKVAGSSRLKLFIEDYIAFWEKSNNREKTIMKDLKDYFEGKEKDWEDFVKASEYIEKIKADWFQTFSQKLDSLRIGDWKYDKVSNDFRWFLSDWNHSLSFVYEPTKGLTIWKSEFKKDKKQFESKFRELFARDFFFEEDSSSNYVMNFKNDSIIYHDTSKFHWIMGNNPDVILNLIQPILKTYMENPKVIEFFRQIDENKS